MAGVRLDQEVLAWRPGAVARCFPLPGSSLWRETARPVAPGQRLALPPALLVEYGVVPGELR
ncbi:hypothetical protein ABZ532_28655 [Streptomyces sp. NPDC019396]|uniref:hypothetical protein n=1 Tax=Streptomyces sp. NPDC019396 TaxID=3154687 RepID=UPI00340127B6